MDEPRAYYTEWSKSEWEKQVSYINTYMWNLDRQHWWTYLQRSSGDADAENRFMDMGQGKGEGEGGPNGDSNMETYTLSLLLSCSVVSDSVWPHRRQPTTLPCPWDSPGKNTAVGCHLLLQCMKVKSESEVTQSRLTLSDPMDCSLPGSSIHGIFQARVLEWVAIAFSLQLFLVPYSFFVFCCSSR